MSRRSASRASVLLTVLGGFALGTVSCGAGGGVSLPPEPVTVPTCGSGVCDSAIGYVGEIAVGSPSEVLGLTLTLCHQDLCASRRPAILLDTDTFDCRVSGLLEATCTLRPVQSGSTSYRLEIAFAGPGEDYQPGDRFRVRVESSAAVLLNWSGSAASYREERPRGEGCAPLCRYATLN